MKHPFRTLLRDLLIDPILDLKDWVIGMFVVRPNLKKLAPASTERDES